MGAEAPIRPPEVGIVQTESVRVHGLFPPAGEPDSKAYIEGNVDSLQPQIIDALEQQPWFKKLKPEILANKKSAIIVASLGAVTLLVAAAGVEFGVRHGRDLRNFLNRAEEQP